MPKIILNKEEYLVVNVSVQKTASAKVVTSKSAFYGIIIKTDGSNDVTFSVYNGEDATGEPLLPEDILVDKAENLWAFGLGDVGLAAEDGIYVAVTCSGSVTYQVLYLTGGYSS